MGIDGVTDWEVGATALRLIARRGEAMRSIARELGLPRIDQTEAERMLSIKAAAVPPERCGPDMPAAPARGPMVAFAPSEMRLGENGYELQHAGFRGRDAARAADAFDRMTDQARRRGGADPFTASQKAAGRTYAALVERHSCIGLKGRSVETMMTGRSGGSGDGVQDLILDEGSMIASMRRAIGDGWALEVTRNTKRRRTPLSVRDLVDQVCLQDRTISEVLEACGWAIYGETVIWARASLCSALIRMGHQSKGLDA